MYNLVSFLLLSATMEAGRLHYFKWKPKLSDIHVSVEPQGKPNTITLTEKKKKKRNENDQY